MDPTVVELLDPAAGKNRFGGAQEGKSCSSPDAPRRDREEKAGAAEPLPKNAESTSVSIVGVPGTEFPGVVKGEFAEYTEDDRELLRPRPPSIKALRRLRCICAFDELLANCPKLRFLPLKGLRMMVVSKAERCSLASRALPSLPAVEEVSAPLALVVDALGLGG